MTVRLRPMRSADVDALVLLAQTLFAGDPPWSAEHFESELAGVPQTRWYVVAEVDGDLAGYAGLMASVATRQTSRPWLWLRPTNAPDRDDLAHGTR